MASFMWAAFAISRVLVPSKPCSEKKFIARLMSCFLRSLAQKVSRDISKRVLTLLARQQLGKLGSFFWSLSSKLSIKELIYRLMGSGRRFARRMSGKPECMVRRFVASEK